MDSVISQELLQVETKITNSEPTHVESEPLQHSVDDTTESPENRPIYSTDLDDDFDIMEELMGYVSPLRDCDNNYSNNTNEVVVSTHVTEKGETVTEQSEAEKYFIEMGKLMGYVSPLRDNCKNYSNEFAVTTSSNSEAEHVTEKAETRYFIMVDSLPERVDQMYDLDDILEDTMDVLINKNRKLIVYDNKSISSVYHQGFFIREIVCRQKPEQNTNDLETTSYFASNYTLGEKFPLWESSTYEKFSLNRNEYIIDKLAESGCIDILRKMSDYDKKHFSYSSRAVDRASGNGHIEVLTWFQKSGYLENNYSQLAFDLAAERGRTDSLDWWRCNELVSFSRYMGSSTIVAAIRSKQYGVLEWFREKMPTVLDSTCGPIHAAIEQNDASIIVWYLDNKLKILYDAHVLPKASPYIKYLLKDIQPIRSPNLESLRYQSSNRHEVESMPILTTTAVELSPASSLTKYALYGAAGLTTGYLISKKLFWK